MKVPSCKNCIHRKEAKRTNRQNSNCFRCHYNPNATENNWELDPDLRDDKD